LVTVAIPLKTDRATRADVRIFLMIVLLLMGADFAAQ
jgi:hypothetical protein